tara:strand:+ start:66 stop:467 length:402 start_codon:yes stop_codon:yes gene_type:complete
MKKYKILIVLADFYEDISSALLGRAKLQIPYKYAEPKNIKVIKVPGVFEIPVTISKNIKKYDAFIALGCVIKGETPHFDFISSATTNAIMKLSVDSKKPIGNGIITCLDRNQAEDRINKALGAVNAVISVLEQ